MGRWGVVWWRAPVMLGEAGGESRPDIEAGAVIERDARSPACLRIHYVLPKHGGLCRCRDGLGAASDRNYRHEAVHLPGALAGCLRQRHEVGRHREEHREKPGEEQDRRGRSLHLVILLYGKGCLLVTEVAHRVNGEAERAYKSRHVVSSAARPFESKSNQATRPYSLAHAEFHRPCRSARPRREFYYAGVRQTSRGGAYHCGHLLLLCAAVTHRERRYGADAGHPAHCREERSPPDCPGRAEVYGPEQPLRIVRRIDLLAHDLDGARRRARRLHLHDRVFRSRLYDHRAPRAEPRRPLHPVSHDPGGPNPADPRNRIKPAVSSSKGNISLLACVSPCRRASNSPSAPLLRHTKEQEHGWRVDRPCGRDHGPRNSSGSAVHLLPRAQAAERRETRGHRAWRDRAVGT